jgi:putative FmdB family regulatory protein
MPIYEYICEDCRAPYEKLVFKTGQPVECPSCGSAKAQMQLSVFRAQTGGKSSASGGGCGCTPKTCGCS